MLKCYSRVMLLAAFAAVAACTDSTGPTVAPDDDLSDFSVGVTGDQAGLPGIMTGSRGVPGTAGCTFNAATGRIECPPVTREGLTFVRSLQLLDAAGVPQAQRGDNVVSVNTKIDVTGTHTGRDNATFTVDRSSDMTVSGLGPTSNQLTHNGTEEGTITGTRTHSTLGQVNFSETFTHTTVNVVIPKPVLAFTGDRRRPDRIFPVSGTSTRSVEVERTVVSSGETSEFSHSEIITFNGTAIVPVVVTRNGETRNCTRNLLTGRMRCE